MKIGKKYLVIIFLIFFLVVFLKSTETTGQSNLITFDRNLDCTRCGQHKAPPLTDVNMTVTAKVSDNVADGILIDYYPVEWNVIDANGGSVSSFNSSYNKIEWNVGNVSDSVSRWYLIKSPALTSPPTKYYFFSELASQKSDLWFVIVSDPGYEYVYPVLNQNFTSDASGWVYGEQNLATDYASGAWSSSGGRTDAGSYLFKNDDTSATGIGKSWQYINYSFQFNNYVDLVNATVYCSFKLTADDDYKIRPEIRLVRPDGSVTQVYNGTTYTGTAAWNSGWINVSINVTSNFTSTGTYQLSAITYSETDDAGSNVPTTLIQNYIDDCGIELVYPQENPRWGNQSQSTSIPGFGAKVSLSAYWTDNAVLSKAWLATNETGSWENKTSIYLISFGGTASGWSNFTWQNSSVSAGTIVGWRIYANDTANNQNVTDIMTFEVKPTYLLVNLTFPSPLTYTETNPYQVLQSNIFWGNATVKCYSTGVGGSCGSVYGSIRYNKTGTSPSEWINTSEGAVPFFTTLPNISIQDYEWKFTSPTGMVQNAGYDTYSKDSLNFTIKGWQASAKVDDGPNYINITPMNGATNPWNILTDGTNGFGINWAILPLSDIWASNVSWSGTTVDTGYTVYNLLETGVLSIYWGNAGSGRKFELIGSSNFANPSANIYTLGNMRVRVVTGTPTLSANNLTVTPSGSTIQILVYNRTLFDTASVNQLGALTTAQAGEVVETTGYVKEKHTRYILPWLNIDKYLAIDPVNNMSTGLVANGTTLYFSDSSGNFYMGWGVSFGAQNGPKNGYPRAVKTLGISLNGASGSGVYNIYANQTTCGGRYTMTFASVRRVTKPYSIYYYPKFNQSVFYFSESINDCSEDLATITNMTRHEVVFAFQYTPTKSTVIEGLKIEALKDIGHTGEEGYSIDVGWRHDAAMTSPKFKYRNSTGAWLLDTAWSDAAPYYKYPEGNGGYPITTQRSFVTNRHHSGQWGNRANEIAYWMSSTNQHVWFGPMKDIHSTDIMPAGAVMNTSGVYTVEPNSTVPSDSEAESEYLTFQIPSTVVLTKMGLVNLTHPNATTNNTWDVGIDSNGEPRIFRKGANPSPCGSLSEGDQCQLNWKTNATGAINSIWTIDANFTSSYSSILENKTDPAYVKITSGADNPPAISTNAAINNTTAVVPAGAVVKWNVTVTDDNGVSKVFFQNSTANYTATQNVNEWYITQTCTVSKTENWQKIFANDTINQWSVNSSVGLAWECDASAPAVASTGRNATSVYTNQYICVNHTATDAENHLDKTWVQITFPNNTAINITTTSSGDCCIAANSFCANVNVGSTAGTLTVNTSFANDTVGQTGYQSPYPNLAVTVQSAAGYLEVNLIGPPSSFSVTQNQTFNVNASVYCRNGSCGEVNGTVRYNGSSSNPDTSIPTSYATPFYVTQGNQPQTCGNMIQDQFCQLNWTVNATGEADSVWKIGVLFNSTQAGVQENHTSNSTVAITACTESITLGWDIDFGTYNPNTPASDNPALGNTGKLYNITNSGTCDLKVWIKGSEYLENITYNSKIYIGNLTWTNISSEYSSSYPNMTTSWSLVNETLLGGGNYNITTYYWLAIPPVYAGRYNGTVTICGNYSSVC